MDTQGPAGSMIKGKRNRDVTKILVVPTARKELHENCWRLVGGEDFVHVVLLPPHHTVCDHFSGLHNIEISGTQKSK